MKRVLIGLLVLSLSLCGIGVFADGKRPPNEGDTYKVTEQNINQADEQAEDNAEENAEEADDNTDNEIDQDDEDDQGNTENDDEDDVDDEDDEGNTDNEEDEEDNGRNDKEKDKNIRRQEREANKQREKDRREQIKRQLRIKKQERKEARINAKECIKELKKLFKDADVQTRKEILKEIAEIKRELKDYSIGVFMRGIFIDFEKYDNVRPRIEKQRTLVPLRAILEAYEATVTWDGSTDTITITKGENTIIIWPNNPKAIVNGREVELEVMPTIENGRTLVPIRFVAESLGIKVDWDGESQTIIIEE